MVSLLTQQIKNSSIVSKHTKNSNTKLKYNIFIKNHITFTKKVIIFLTFVKNIVYYKYTNVNKFILLEKIMHKRQE